MFFVPWWVYRLLPYQLADLEIVAHRYDGGPTEVLDKEYLMKCQMCFAHTIIM